MACLWQIIYVCVLYGMPYIRAHASGSYPTPVVLNVSLISQSGGKKARFCVIVKRDIDLGERSAVSRVRLRYDILCRVTGNIVEVRSRVG